MRRINSEFKTGNLSEEGQQLANRDYFGYVEMDDFAFYAMADSLDGELVINSARIAVESLIRDFTEHPSMKKKALSRYLRQAHRELQRQKKGLHLKASVVIAVTDYRKIRYCHAGNSRFCLIRNGRVLERTIDQSLTQNLISEGKAPLDQAAAHEERNNLYSYLGERGTPKIRISKKVKLENGDIFALLTRGVWERCQEPEFLGLINDGKDLDESLGQVEDAVLRDQEEVKIDNYSLALTFVNKVYRPPEKKWTFKKIMMMVLPVLLVCGGIGLGFYLRHRNIQAKIRSLDQYMESGELYLRYDNYQKASEEYGEALKLAKGLKRQDESREADQYKKLAEQIMLADEAMASGEYQKAQELYLTAGRMSAESGNIGRAYIYSQLGRTKEYIEIFDLIDIGEQKEEYGDLKGAVKSYKEARAKAADLYYKEGKEEALARQMAAEEKIEEEAQEAVSRQKEIQESAAEEAAKKQQEQAAKQELENQQKANDQQNAIDLENQGNELMTQGQYESAITFYQTAQAIYIRLELADLADGLNSKIGAARAGIEAIQESKAAAESESAAEEESRKAEEAKKQSEEFGPWMQTR